MSVTHVAWRCACGAEFTGPIDRGVERKVRGLWDNIHRGPGHEGEPGLALTLDGALADYLGSELGYDLAAAAGRDPLALRLAAAAERLTGGGGTAGAAPGRQVEPARSGAAVKPPEKDA